MNRRKKKKQVFIIFPVCWVGRGPISTVFFFPHPNVCMCSYRLGWLFVYDTEQLFGLWGRNFCLHLNKSVAVIFVLRLHWLWFNTFIWRLNFSIYNFYLFRNWLKGVTAGHWASWCTRSSSCRTFTPFRRLFLAVVSVTGRRSHHVWASLLDGHLPYCRRPAHPRLRHRFSINRKSRTSWREPCQALQPPSLVCYQG